MGPAVCLWFSAHLSDLEVVWITYETEGTNVDSAVICPETSHMFSWTVTNTLTSHTWSSLFIINIWRANWIWSRERSRESRSTIISDLHKPGLLCHCHAHHSTSCYCLVLQQIWISLVDWFLPLCLTVSMSNKARQYWVSQNRGLRYLVREWNSRAIVSGPLAHICACFTVIYTANFLTL